MKTEEFGRILKSLRVKTVVGVPDSTLKEFCAYLEDGTGFDHRCAANEGAAVGMAMGAYLGTGRPACVYMQNSGLGNIVNPYTSLVHPDVYGVPMLFVIGWRGEPGEKDEPQHQFMGKITPDLLRLLEIDHAMLDRAAPPEALTAAAGAAEKALTKNRCFAFVIKKGTFEPYRRATPPSPAETDFVREDAIAEILKGCGENDRIVSTTGKISREVYEQSDQLTGGHQNAFLTVGGMGHASMIAYGLARSRPDTTVLCLDGDGAALMHLGNAAVAGEHPADNLIHICLNNRAHESVGGMETGAPSFGFRRFAQLCGYRYTACVRSAEELREALACARRRKVLSFIEVRVNRKSRADLGRPRESAGENKRLFMNTLKAPADIPPSC